MCLLQEPEVVSVSLQSQDFIGLGFNIWGSMRDGVFVSQVHNRGPAIETGKIKPGASVCLLASSPPSDSLLWDKKISKAGSANFT